MNALHSKHPDGFVSTQIPAPYVMSKSRCTQNHGSDANGVCQKKFQHVANNTQGKQSQMVGEYRERKACSSCGEYFDSALLFYEPDW